MTKVCLRGCHGLRLSDDIVWWNIAVSIPIWTFIPRSPPKTALGGEMQRTIYLLLRRRSQNDICH
jgi:hypothetical protein